MDGTSGGQEESIVRNWIKASADTDEKKKKEFDKILRQWGVKVLPGEINKNNCKRMDSDEMVNYYSGETKL